MTRLAVLGVAVVLATGLAGAEDKAKSRDGSSSSGSAAGSRHHSSSSSSSSASKSSSSSKSDSGKTSSSSTSSSTPTPAQRRHPRAGTGTGDYPYDHDDHSSPSVYFGYPAYYYSGSAGYSGGSEGPHGSDYGYRDTGSLRVIVDPEKTRVYVDGYYAGTAGDFDGLLQRLHVSAGRHDIMLKLDGYRTHHFRVRVPVGQTVKLRHDMVRGTGEDEDRVVGDEPEVRGGPAGYARLEEEGTDARVGNPRRAIPAGTGRLRVDVRPPDASIYIDGVFRGPARATDGVLLPSGRHRVEIVRPGYRTEEREIEVPAGGTTDLRADLAPSS